MIKILKRSLADYGKLKRQYELLKREMDLQDLNMPQLSQQPEKEKSEKRKMDP